jgi:hypothetical protein
MDYRTALMNRAALINRRLASTPVEADHSDCNHASQSGQPSIGSVLAIDCQRMVVSNETEVCLSPALELFNQACSAYLDCESGSRAEWQCHPPMLSMSDVAANGSVNTLPAAKADGQSVDAALPLLLDEIELFIANLRDENESDIFAAD